ncbi:MAG TPA: tRNA dimethylallyltransferase, partial [Sphingobacterium sp.]|nr:tRNA dimethylallyltransferase [Sphingobacterium sp.]
EPGERYNVSCFLEDFGEAYRDIRARDKAVVVCGGTGFYIQALLEPRPYAQVPTQIDFRQQLAQLDKAEIRAILEQKDIPDDFKVDYSSKKRMIRAVEILDWLAQNPHPMLPSQPVYTAKIIGLAPDLETRRRRISERLQHRLKNGLIDEVKNLLKSGLTHEDLVYYGLEYKYSSYYLQGKMTDEEFVRKLETEIQRYAKRQMTYFRKMEKDGITVYWIS